MIEKWKDTLLRLLIYLLAGVNIILLFLIMFNIMPKKSQSDDRRVISTISYIDKNLQNSGIGGKGAESFLIKSSETILLNEGENFIFVDSNSRYLTRADLTGLSDWKLKLARNEIYARYGRAFKDPAVSEYFLSKPWYTPIYTSDEFDLIEDVMFNAFELANSNLIQREEELRR